MRDMVAVAPAVPMLAGSAASPPRRLLAVARAGRCARRAGLLEKRESLYNNIFIFGDADTVTMTFGQNKRYYTESSMKLVGPGRADGRIHPLHDARHRLSAQGRAHRSRSASAAAAPCPISARRCPTPASSRSSSTRTWSISPRNTSSSRRPRGCARWCPTAARSCCKDSEKWDVILIDAYRGPFVPFHLLTKEFYTLVKSRLNPGGVVVQNIEPSTMLFDSASATLKSVFPSVDLYDGGGNVVAVGYDGPQLPQAELLARAAKVQERYKLRYDLPAGRRAARADAADRQGHDRRFRAGRDHARDREEQREVEGTDGSAPLMQHSTCAEFCCSLSPSCSASR